MKRIIGVAWVLMLTGSVSATDVANFDDLALAPQSYWNGSADPSAGGFTTGGATFNNRYVIDEWSGWAFWGGWSYSNMTDTTTPGYENQYGAITGGGQSGSNYGVAYVDTWAPTLPTLTFSTPTVLEQAYFTNGTYPYLIMHDGDPNNYAKKFGGATGNDPDWLLLTITGKDAQGQTTGTVDFYLADFRSSDNTKDYILNTWTPADLSGLGQVKSVVFTLSGSDSDPFYGWLNTPAYFAMDSLSAVPEPATLSLLGLGALAALRRRMIARGAAHE